MNARREDLIAAAIFVAGTLLLFLTAPHEGEFWWSDAPRHALNGAFIKDFIAAMPAHPTAWAMQYYVKYPALTILFYPPLFYVVLAPFYALFGVTHVTAINVQSVTGIPDAAVSRDSVAGWIWYARQLPWQLGWPLCALAVLAVPLAIVGRLSERLTRADLVLIGGWFALGYLFLSVIDLKEARHALVFLPILLVAAGLSIDALLPSRAVGPALLVLVIGTGVYTWLEAPTPFVSGYREAAEWIAHEAPKDAVVVFSGKRDGSFVFNMRTIPTRHDISILRSDKLLLDVAVRRTLGVKQNDLSEQQIGDLLDRDGVSYVVAQDDFWTDIPEMARFQDVLRSPHFQAVAHIPIVSNVFTENKNLTIYRNTDDISSGPHMVDLHLPIIGTTVKGTIGK